MCSPLEDTTPDETTIPLIDEELHLLCTAPGRIYTSTDGSVKQAQTLEASSTRALSIRISPTITISRRGKSTSLPEKNPHTEWNSKGWCNYTPYCLQTLPPVTHVTTRRRSRHTKSYTTMRENRPKNGRKLSTESHSSDSIRKCSVEAVTPCDAGRGSTYTQTDPCGS